MQREEPLKPEGVELYDPDDTDSLRERLEGGIKSAFERYVNGFSYGTVKLEVNNLTYADKERYSLAEQREALLRDKVLARRLKGNMRLVDTETNEVLDERQNVTLARVPWVTQRGTFINNGSEYSPIMQSRLLPGAYTRKRENGEVETSFNVRPGTGSSMKVSMRPDTGVYRVKIGSSDLHAYSFFRAMGVDDTELQRRWGKDVWEINKAGYDPRVVDRAYVKAIPKWQREGTKTADGKVQEIREALDRAQVAASVINENLPTLTNREKAASWRSVGQALVLAGMLDKWAGDFRFSPDLTPNEVTDSFLEFEFGLMKSAEFEPDLDSTEIGEAYESLYDDKSPRLASLQHWPEHWLDEQDTKGWLQWYHNYSNGRRSDQDERQKGRWKSFKRRHGAAFVSNPTPRRAYSLRNWAIDPLKLLPEKEQNDFAQKMEDYRKQEYVKWYLLRHKVSDRNIDSLRDVARLRGADVPEGRPTKVLTQLALEGYLNPEDFKRS